MFHYNCSVMLPVPPPRDSSRQDNRPRMKAGKEDSGNMFEEIQEISGVLRLLELSEENPACWIADEHKVNYGEHNPFDIFAASLVPIYKEDKMCGLSIEADPGYGYNYCVGLPAIQMPNALTGPAAPLNS